MARKKRGRVPLSRRSVPEVLRAKARPPLVVVLGSPAEVVNLLTGCEFPPETAPEDIVCYQMDLFQAERLRQELAEADVRAEVTTLPDLWDLPGQFRTAIYLPARGGERELKIDMVEQAYHVLRPHGLFVVWSSYGLDLLFPSLFKKVFGKASEHREGQDAIFWSPREGDRPRRRHEQTFQARIAGRESCRFLSRPGTFSYGKFDDGSRALAEIMEVEPADRVVDLGCGCGTNGIFASQLTGPEGFIAFIDSNVRAVALAEENARANGVAHFAAIASSNARGPQEGSFDVALANPPYFASGSISEMFVDRARALLKPDGRFFLVTKQPHQVAEAMVDTFGPVEGVLCRGYTVLYT